MADAAHTSIFVPSGDVILHARVFGKAGKTPMVILHGAAYFDSYDWIEVAAKIATDREVIAMDMRGFGKSSWSPSKDYSTDAKLDDIRAVMTARSWSKIVLMVHSMTGRIGVMFAATHPDLIEKLVVVDSALGGGAGGGGEEPKLNQAPQLFQSVEEAMKTLAGRASPPRFSRDRARAEKALRKVEGGFMLTRDPDIGNVTPQWPGIRTPKLNGGDIWDGLKNTKCPVRYVSGLKSDRRKPDALAKLVTQKNVTVSDVNAEHDVAGQAPDELVEIVKGFLAT